jgi:histidine ammonia-lyase
MWIHLLNSVATGSRGLRLETVDAILALLNNGVLAQVPSKGSVGASGDLAPAAHAALTLIGEGACTMPIDDHIRVLPAQEALRQIGLSPLVLGPKEGLSLINGTQLTTAYACQAWTEAETLWRTATLALSLSTFGFRTSPSISRNEILELHHPSTLYAGLRKHEWFAGAALPFRNHDQDPYCFRCAPQVHGAIWKDIEQCEEWVVEELAAVTDNPIILPETHEFIHGGNFHAIYPARVLDRLASAMTQLASISERRINLGMDSRKTGLPDFLTPESGLNSGLMMAQTTAAALVSECKALSFPASVDTIPTNCDQEDHVSMGPIAGWKATQICRNVRDVLAIEILAAFQAIHLRGRAILPPRLNAAFEVLCGHVAPIEHDRIFSEDIRTISRLIESGVLLVDFTGEADREIAGSAQ